MKYTAGVVRGKLETQQKKKKSFFRKVGITGLKAIENITSFPERRIKELAQWVKEDLDEQRDLVNIRKDLCLTYL